MSLISIITVNHNQTEVTVELLKSISRYGKYYDIEVIVVDNESREYNKEIFKSEYVNLIYIYPEINLGFAGGNNLGIKDPSGEFLLFLNNDTEISPNLFRTLDEEFKDNPKIGLLSPLILYDDTKT